MTNQKKSKIIQVIEIAILNSNEYPAVLLLTGTGLQGDLFTPQIRTY